MKIRIEDGKTIITTDRKSGETINKTKVKGLTYMKDSGRYNLSIVYEGKKYHIGNYKSIEEAKSIRKKADGHIENGTFIQWINDFKKTAVSNSYGVKGLSKKKNRFQLNISVKGSKYFLGSFASIEDAAIIRNEAEKQLQEGTFFEWLEFRKKK